MKIISIVEFIQWKYDNFEPGISPQMFRGQLDSRWPLLPTIVRYAEKLSEREIAFGGFSNISGLESVLIDKFERFALPFKDYRSISPLEKLVHAQHYGLPTRLLDWTTNPLKALYYAVENPELDYKDGIVYEASPEGWGGITENVGISPQLMAFFPELLNERISAQEGCFISFPLPEIGFDVLPLSKENYGVAVSLSSIQIDSTRKREIRLALSELGVNHRTMNPGLDGVAKWVKSDFTGFRI